jgi:fimbrial isopeptide formation D2 family protein/LPXTG-motif cell wall-anchored protein
MTSKTHGGVRAAGAFLVAALVALGGAAAAEAATPTPAPAVNLIDSTTKGSISIHKYENPATATGLPHDGTEQTVTGLTPMPDVTFTVQQVDPTGLDLTTNAGWAALAELTPTDAKNGPFGQERKVTTDANGLAVAAALPVGVYLVTETAYPAGATPSAPFLVTVPLTDPVNDARWLYHVHVYPKNSVSTLTKTVDDEPAQRFDDVVWTILGDIPDVEAIDGYKIVDALDSRLDYVSTTVSLTNGAKLLLDEDYTVSYDSTTNTVTVQFIGTGLTTLAQNSAAQVKVVIATRANAAGEIPNAAVLYPNLPSFTAETGKEDGPGGPVVTPEVETKWGNVTLYKFAEGAEGKKVNLRGAQFAIYLSEEDARAGVNAIATATTGDDGTLTFTGLRYSAWSDGEPVAPGKPGYQSYWVAETKAPDGYELLAAPIEVVVDDEDTAVDYEVENVPNRGGFTLPVTGGLGTAALSVAGLFLVACGLLMVRKHRRDVAAA